MISSERKYSIVPGFFLLVLVLLSVASHAQEGRRVTDSFSSESLGAVLTRWEDQFDLRFAYDATLVAGLTVSASLDAVPADDALAALLEPVGLTFRLIRGTYVLYPMDIEPPVTGEVRRTNLTWSGVITDAETGETLPFTVALISGLPAVFSADANGRLVLSGIPSDTCMVRFSYLGYESRTYRAGALEALPGSKVRMVPRRTFLPAAVVEAQVLDLLSISRSEGDFALDPSDMSSIGPGGEKDVLRGAQLLPGISGTGESSSSFALRGSDADQVLVLLDDMTIYHLDHFYGAFSAINPDAVKHIQITRSGLEARHGGRAAGLIQVTGKDGNLYRPQARINLGTLSGSLALETPLGTDSSRTSLLIAMRRSYTDLVATPVFRKLYSSVYASGEGQEQVSGAQVFASDGPEYYFQDITARVTVRGRKNNALYLSGYGGTDALNHSFVSSGQAQRFSYADENTWGNRGASARWVTRQGAGSRWTIAGAWSRYASDFFSTDSLYTGSSESQVTNKNLSMVLQDASSRVEWTRSRARTEWTFGGHLVFQEVTHNRRISGALTTATNRAATSSAYVQSVWRYRKWSFRPGLRLSHFSGTARFYPEWRSIASVALAPSVAVRVSLTRQHQFIHRVITQSLALNDPDFWQLSGTDNLPVLRSDQLAMGIGRTWKGWTLDAEVYAKRQTGVFEYLGPYASSVSDAMTDSVVTGTGWIHGLDVLLRYQEGHHHAWLGYSYLVTENEFDALDQKELPEHFDQRHEVKAFYQARWKRWECALTWVWGSGRPYTPLLAVRTMVLPGGNTASMPVFGDLNSGRLPDYHRLDAAVSWIFHDARWEGRITLGVFNVYDRKNLRDIRYVAAGTTDPSGVRTEVPMLGILPSLQLHLTL